MRYPLLTLLFIILAVIHGGDALAWPCEGDDESQIRNDLEPPRPGALPDSLVITDQEIEHMLRRIELNEVGGDQVRGATARDGHRREP
jgi:hypothetical protein